MEDWKKIRKYHLRNMRERVCHVILLMAWMEAIRVGPVQLVYEGKHGYPAAPDDDFGWWLRLPPADKAVRLMTQVNRVLLPMFIGIHLFFYAYHAICAFIYVDSQPKDSKRFPINTHKNWLMRLPMLLGIALSTAGGYGAFKILATWDLAYVTPIEYSIIVVPAQISLGMFFGTLAQLTMEKRMAERKLSSSISAKQEPVSNHENAGFL
ncbi:hypothetical protein LTR47_011547 [Exophiala xenobiotica]|nr:hypothetical protein LTR92_011239 [Exophiala xenobiotica]KAK5214937.1 hypothetical protein LTR72_011964 [Exophiala xenobiotica]KAK5219306.1 hypothetical protein LTR47_011547 [Exophiala xenobiotica]KAK5242192.1 hypothetical protein LTS06_011676 [Exophiala xenobiotica]KAK5279611.1 hypothetical protein LTR40_007545 [Exophiala xenobiotica]